MSNGEPAAEPTTIAVLDIGANTVRLLVTQVRAGLERGTEYRPSSIEIVPLMDRSEFVRLGLGVHGSGALRPDRMDAAIAAVRALCQEARSLGADSVVAIGTSAIRDAENGAAFVHRLRDETGIELRVLTGEEEAEYTYLGATQGVEIDEEVLVCDLGGGSTEIIRADGVAMRWTHSLPVGSGNLTEEFLAHDPPVARECAELQDCVRRLVGELPDWQAKLAICTGGTASHVARISGNDQPIARLSVADAWQIVRSLLSIPSPEIRSKYRLDSQRARVLPGGALALMTIVERFGAMQLLLTRSGIREGAVLKFLEEKVTIAK